MEQVKVVCIKNTSGSVSRDDGLGVGRVADKLLIGCVYNCDTYDGYKRASYRRIYIHEDTWYLFPTEWFVSVEEYRDLKIDKIINE